MPPQAYHIELVDIRARMHAELPERLINRVHCNDGLADHCSFTEQDVSLQTSTAEELRLQVRNGSIFRQLSTQRGQRLGQRRLLVLIRQRQRRNIEALP